ncbi:unnamed protein product [Blepharisma stoltei]|uniref:VTT domain-containing protein n=1 Tax=Blepharisma stoltei TaxID=1481888 RepID=A0AAU9JUJ0_9CILI|nr:unnamed protein product [Blepharisma stoltei]
MDDPRNRIKFIKQSMSITIAILLFAVFIVCIIEIDVIFKIFIDYSNWTKENPVYGLLLIQVVCIIGLIIMIPSTLFALTIGYICGMLCGEIFGFILGILLISVTSQVAAVLSFFLARYLFRDMVINNIKEEWVKTRAVLKALETKGIKVVFLCRLSPVIPYGILNYIVGASSIPFQHFFIGNLGLIPGFSLYVYIAVTMGSVQEALSNQTSSDWYWYLIAIGGVLIIATCIYITWVSKKELQKILDEQEESEAPLFMEEEHEEVPIDPNNI